MYDDFFSMSEQEQFEWLIANDDELTGKALYDLMTDERSSDLIKGHIHGTVQQMTKLNKMKQFKGLFSKQLKDFKISSKTEKSERKETTNEF